MPICQHDNTAISWLKNPFKSKWIIIILVLFVLSDQLIEDLFKSISIEMNNNEWMLHYLISWLNIYWNLIKSKWIGNYAPLFGTSETSAAIGRQRWTVTPTQVAPPTNHRWAGGHLVLFPAAAAAAAAAAGQQLQQQQHQQQQQQQRQQQLTSFTFFHPIRNLKWNSE